MAIKIMTKHLLAPPLAGRPANTLTAAAVFLTPITNMACRQHLLYAGHADTVMQEQQGRGRV